MLPKLLFLMTALGATASAETFVVCSPGSPGTTDEAQPRMSAFGAALSDKSGAKIDVVYDPSDAGGVKRLQGAGIGLVSLPFFLQHETELGLRARAQAVGKGRQPLERWALVTAKERVQAPDGLTDTTLVTSVAFAPAFIRGFFGTLPASAKIQQSTSVLSWLRKAANGERVAVVLDATQEASLATLPFAAKLGVMTHSIPLPVGLVVTIDARMPAKTWDPIGKALLGLPEPTLDAIQLSRFEAVDDKTLEAARRAFAAGQK